MVEKTFRFLVVVVPAGIAPSKGVQSWTMISGPVIKTVTASSAKEAAEQVGVPAGGTAHVTKLAHVAKFKRPLEADLVPV